MHSVVRTEVVCSPSWLLHPSQRTRLHVSDLCMSSVEFARHQRRASERDLAELVWNCRDRYLYAQRLLHPGSGLPTRSNAPDLSRLYRPWDKICVTYRCHIFDPQIDFFEPQRERELSRWYDFQRRYCFDPILDEPAYTRCVLEAVGLLETSTTTQLISLEAMFERLNTNILERYRSHDPIEQ